MRYRIGLELSWVGEKVLGGAEEGWIDDVVIATF